MRIALLSEHASPLADLGGVDADGENIAIAHVARCLVEEGHEVDVLTRRDAPRQPPVVTMLPGLRVLHLDAGPAGFVRDEDLPRWMPAFAAACLEACSQGLRYDVVHADSPRSAQVAALLKRRLGLPFVMNASPSDPDGDDIADDTEEGIEDEADAVVNYRAFTGFDPLAFAPMSRAEARSAAAIAPDAFVVLQRGCAQPRDGGENVLRAFALLGADARLVIAFDDVAGDQLPCSLECQRLAAIARRLGVAARVDFLGRGDAESRRRLACAANVFVSTPWHAPLGASPLQAMACGTPVIAADAGGEQHAVLDGVTGFLVPSNDPAALAVHLGYLHDHPALARALGLAGLRRARTMFTWEAVAAQLAETYRQLLPTLPRADGSGRRSHLRLVPRERGLGTTSSSAGLAGR